MLFPLGSFLSQLFQLTGELLLVGLKLLEGVLVLLFFSGELLLSALEFVALIF